MKTYEEFDGDFLKIAETIQQRRYQLLVHSCIYYELNRNLISDKKWDEWARELRDLQNKYPDISKRVTLYEAFADWDASTGAFLPIKESWVVQRANWLLLHQGKTVDTEYLMPKQEVKAEPTKTLQTKQKKLF